MAGGLFDFNFEDPQQVGQSAFGAALLNAGGASRMPVSTGQALAQGMVARQQAAAEAMQNVRRNQLIAAQIAHMQAQDQRLARESKSAGQPASVRTAMWYANEATPQEKQAFGFSVRNNVVRGPNGELYMNDPAEGLRRITDFEKTLIETQDIASAKAYGGGLGEAATKPREVTGPDGRPAYATDLNVLMQGGLTGAPRLAQPGFGAAQPVPPLQPQFRPQPAMVQRPQSTPNIPPQVMGQAPTGYGSLADLNAALGQAEAPFQAAAGGQPQPQYVPQTVQAAPQGLLQPPSAGAAVLAGEREAATKAAALTSKRNDEFPAAKGALDSLKTSTKSSLDLIDKLENSKGEYYNTGYLANIPLRMVKGHPAFDDEQQMQRLRDVGVIEVMKQLKALSTTGATGFGALSEKEGTRLENAKAALATGLTGKERAAQLAIMKDAMQNIQKIAQDVFDTEYKDQSLNALRSKYLQK